MHIGKDLHILIKAFMDDTTLIMNRKQVVQKTLDKLDNLLQWCRMAFKPVKSRSQVKGKIRRDEFFDMGRQRIPKVSKEPVKNLGRVIDKSLIIMNMIKAALLQVDNVGGHSMMIPYLEQCMEDVPAPACLHDKAMYQ